MKTVDVIDVSKQKKIDYETFNWILIIGITVGTVIDRFTVNLWPLGVDSPHFIVPNAHWSISVFETIAWISARMMLVSSSYIVLFQNDVFFNWLFEHYLKHKNDKWYYKWLEINDIRQSNHKLHKYIGIYFIGIPVLLHVWSIFFAALFPENDIQFLSSWKRADQNGTKIPFYANGLLTLGWNDTYRVITTSLCFFILFPYSMIKRFKERNWSIAMYLHLFAAAIYMIDLIRIQSHPHCWVFNVPFIFWWICDRIYGIWFYRRSVANVIKKINLGKKNQKNPQYMILYLRVDDDIFNLASIGDIYYLNTLDCGLDRAHPFTVFYNHHFVDDMVEQYQIENEEWSGHKFQIGKKLKSIEMTQSEYMIKRAISPQLSISIDQYHQQQQQQQSEIAEVAEIAEIPEIPLEHDWNIGVIAQIHPDHNKYCDNRKTWTNKIANMNIRYLSGLRCWGPYRSDYYNLHSNFINNQCPLVLLSTGAGCGYMIDFYYYFTSQNLALKYKVEYYFSTRSIAMFQWFTNITCTKNINNFKCNAHITTKEKKICIDDQEAMYKQGKSTRNAFIGRLSFEGILNNAHKNSKVFYCGSPDLQQKVQILCNELDLEFHSGHSFH